MSSAAKGITKEAILGAAFEVLDQDGIDGLTVRRVADRLGVRAPALYWHLRDKQALLDEMGTRVWRAVAEANDWACAADWRDALGSYARRTRQALLAHRDGARVFSGTYLTEPDVLRSQEEGLRWMQGQGFTVEATTEAVSLLTSFVVGHCIEEQARSQAPDDRYAVAVRDQRIGATEHPLVAESGRVLAEGEPDVQFDGLLAVILDGIAARLRTPGG